MIITLILIPIHKPVRSTNITQHPTTPLHTTKTHSNTPPSHRQTETPFYTPPPNHNAHPQHRNTLTPTPGLSCTHHFHPPPRIRTHPPIIIIRNIHNPPKHEPPNLFSHPTHPPQDKTMYASPTTTSHHTTQPSITNTPTPNLSTHHHPPTHPSSPTLLPQPLPNYPKTLPPRTIPP